MCKFETMMVVMNIKEACSVVEKLPNRYNTGKYVVYFYTSRKNDVVKFSHLHTKGNKLFGKLVNLLQTVNHSFIHEKMNKEEEEEEEKKTLTI